MNYFVSDWKLQVLGTLHRFGRLFIAKCNQIFLIKRKSIRDKLAGIGVKRPLILIEEAIGFSLDP
ncbi:MAG: hypothetical protein GVY22_11885 [Gammaproteobacteria bacterium]|jgi:hypothetical protein|nr:hypothetical protein [Gammaproteobacteria bacterium]